MKKTLLFLFAMTLFLSGSLFAQVAGEFRSVASGSWNNISTWEVYNAGWAPATIIPNSTTAIATVQVGHTLTMGGAAQVKTLKLDGIVTTTSVNTLTINYLGSIIGGSASAYIDGPLHYQITTALNIPKDINIPLGKGAVGRPVVFKVAHNRANLVTYMFEMHNAAPPAKMLPATLASVSSVRHYTIARTNIAGLTSNCNLTFKYDIDDAVSANNSTLRIVRDGVTAWTDLGGVGSAPDAGVITSVTPTALNASLSLASPTNNVFTLGFLNRIISGNAGVAGATLSWFDGIDKTTVSAANGTYSIYVPNGWSGTITPSLLYYNFSPLSLNFTNVVGNLTLQNFTATSIFTEFRSTGPGDWNDPLIWEGWDGTAWVPSSVPTGVAGTILIRDLDVVNVNVPIGLEAGCTLTNEGQLNVNGSLTIKTGATLVHIGSFGNPGGTLYVYGTLEHRQDGGMIGVAGNFGWTATLYYAGSKVLVTGVVNIAPTVPSQTNMQYMEWNCPNQADDAFLSLNGKSNDAYNKDLYAGFGNLTVLNSNSHNIFMFSGQGRAVGNIVVDGPNSKITAFTGTSTGIEYPFFSGFSSLTVQNGGQFYMSTNTGDATHHVTINIWNNLTVSSNSVLATYGYPNNSGTSLALIGFYPNYSHTLDLSGQVPAPGLDAAANNLNFLVDGNTLTLASPITINNLQFNGTGKIVSGGNLITLLPGASVTGASATSFVDGKVAFQVATTTPTTMTFPVGKGSVGRPVTLTVTQDAATPTTYTAEMLNPPVPANAVPLTVESVSTVRYYNITKGAGANVTDASILMNYSTDDGVGTKNSLLRIAKADGASNWVDLGGTGTAPTTGTITSTSNFTTFSDFALGYAFCVNPTDGGTIAATIISGCDPFDSAIITGTVIPGTVEYIWQSSVAPFTTWTDIASNTVSYNPAALTETTWYKRLVRASCILDWVGAAESNVLVMTVNALPIVTNANAATICSSSSPAISLTASAVSTFTWVVGTITENITGASNGSGLIIDQILTNANAVPGTVQYIVTPTSATGSCAGPNYAITVTVNPLPIITLGAAGPFCTYDVPVQLNGLPASGTYSGTGVSASGLFTPTTAGNSVITYTYLDANGCTASASTTITVNPRPQLQATINGVVVTDNHDGADDLSAIEVCNSTTNNLTLQFADLMALTPATSIKVQQQFTRTNVVFSPVDRIASITYYTTPFSLNVKLTNAALPGTLVMRFRTFKDSNNNNILDASECAGDWIVYTVTVSALLPASVSMAASANPVSAGTLVTYTPTPINGGTVPTYEWFVNSLPVATGATYSYTPVNGDQVYVVMASSSLCATVATATSPALTMTIISNVTATLNAAGPFCVFGTPVQLVGLPAGGTYSGTGVSATGLFTPSAVGNQVITYTYTDINGTAIASTTITVNPRPQLRATINGVIVTDNHDGVDDMGTIEVCNSTTNNLTFQFADLMAVNPTTSIKVQQQFTRTNVVFNPTNLVAQIKFFTTPFNLNVKLTNAALPGTLLMRFRTFMDSNNNNVLDANECAGDWIVYTVTVNALLPAGVSIAASANSVSAGTLVTFTATPINGGTAPTYEWFVNAAPAATGATYSYTPVNGDQVYVVMASSSLCVTVATATSPALMMTILSNVTATLNVAGPFCVYGTPVQLVGLPAGGTYSGTGVSATGLFTPSTVGNQVITYSYTDINGTAISSTTITVNPRPQLRATINSAIVTDNHDGADDMGTIEVCNSTTNNLSLQFADLMALTPTATIKMQQQFNRTNVFFSPVDRIASIVYFTTPFSLNVKLNNAAQPGTLVMRFRTFMDGNNNNVLDASECAGDWIVYTITVNPLPVAAGIIIGSATITPGSFAVPYSVGAIANATSYIWNYTGTGVTINTPDPMAGNAVTLDFAADATTGTLSVIGQNACGDGTAGILNLTDPLKSANIGGLNTISGSSNINSLDSEKGLNAYAIRHIEIRIVGEVSNKAAATLYDILGRVVLNEKLSEGSLNVIPTTNIKMGVYILSVKDAAKLQRFKLVIME